MPFTRRGSRVAASAVQPQTLLQSRLKIGLRNTGYNMVITSTLVAAWGLSFTPESDMHTGGTTPEART